MVIINVELLKYVDKLSKKKEKWKRIKIDGKKTNYSISNFGNIYNHKLDKFYNLDNTDINKYIKWSINVNGEPTRFLVHRLVAIYFCEIPKRYKKKGLTFDDLVVNHKNGIKYCNASFNLEWVTTKENTEHAWKNGFCDGIRGEKARLAKITEEQAIQICELIMKKKNNKEISESLGVTEYTVEHIRFGQCWKHIVCKYKFPKLGKSKPFQLSDNTIHQICKKLELKTLSDSEIAKEFGVSREFVRDIRLKKRRKKISQFYNF
jgi:HNH homing endonuclease|nr:MAG TPA: homing endonuclease [Caudoviricetes sp.]